MYHSSCSVQSSFADFIISNLSLFFNSRGSWIRSGTIAERKQGGHLKYCKHRRVRISSAASAGSHTTIVQGRLYEKRYALGILVTILAVAHAFVIQPVSFQSAPVLSGQITLHGSLVSPSSGSSRYPGVLLISGSGPNDRWEDSGSSRPFYDIATFLADAGFVVLTYDKRSCSSSTHSICSTVFCSQTVTTNCVQFNSITLDDFQSDAQQALAFLKQQQSVMPHNLTIIGHSQV